MNTSWCPTCQTHLCEPPNDCPVCADDTRQQAATLAAQLWRRWTP